MTSKRQYDEHSQRQALRDAGWQVPKRDAVAFNSGSESLSHVLAKSSIAWVLKQDGYRIASEIEGPTGVVDLIAYGTEDVPVAIEVERDMDEAVMQDKLERYCYNQPLRDVLPVDVDTMPSVDALETWARGQI